MPHALPDSERLVMNRNQCGPGFMEVTVLGNSSYEYQHAESVHFVRMEPRSLRQSNKGNDLS